MALTTLADAFHEELRDVLSAEKQLLKGSSSFLIGVSENG